MSLLVFAEEVVTSGRSGHVTRTVPFSSGVKVTRYMSVASPKPLVEIQILFDFVDQTGTQFFAAAVHREIANDRP